MNRLYQLRAALKAHDIAAALYHDPVNARYLTGYTGEGCVLVTEDACHIITDFRYIEQAGRQAPKCRVHRTGNGISAETCVRDILALCGANTVGMETGFVTVDTYRRFENALSDVCVKSLPPIAEELRCVKDEGEIASIVKAAEISCRAFEKMLSVIKPGMTEKQVQAELDYTMLKLGSEKPAFDTIAAAGENGSLPHAVPGDHVIKTGELLTLDFGATVNGYCADMTRTIAIGDVSQAHIDMYETVLAAQKLALDMVAVGVVCKQIDLAARAYLDARFPGAFGHSLGHGVGLYIHEEPRLSYNSDTVLVPGHVVTVEPGVYVPGLGGVRIEDMAILTGDGYINPITAPKQLIVVV